MTDCVSKKKKKSKELRSGGERIDETYFFLTIPDAPSQTMDDNDGTCFGSKSGVQITDFSMGIFPFLLICDGGSHPSKVKSRQTLFKTI